MTSDKHIVNDKMAIEENNIFSDDDNLFADDGDIAMSQIDDNNAWEIMIIDDEEDVHQLTRFVLDDYVYDGRKLKFISAYSAKEAEEMILQHPDVAIILLDVVMETIDSGLKLVKYIREQQQNHFVRIILRTGQSGYAPEKEVIMKYDINDYKNKTELTDQKLFTLVTSGLRAYFNIIEIESYRQDLEKKVEARTRELQQKNEELVILNKKLILLDEEKSEFLSIAAHDLKNPLASIQSLANLIRAAFNDFPKEKLIEFAYMIETSSQKMFDLIKSLLDVNAIESGEMSLIIDSYSLTPITQSVIENYIEPAKQKNIKLNFTSTKKDSKVLVDESAIYQILDNLISNAIKYSPYDKNIYIRISEIKNTVRFEIQDEGQGLSEDDLKQLFGRFKRLTPRPTNNEHSTGLGLFIVKKLVNSMNGKVWCESQVDLGSTFIMEFPTAI
ncbi:MAG: hybrid sensor histidine kinase/response regulator [Thiomargarita sp.]|nr:hybrid sensor histidine kinase/response regulator [Thiomargarita sp.]